MIKEINILLVEDDTEDAYLIRNYMREGFGGLPITYNLQEATSYAEALEQILKNPYHICLFDYRLGEVSGLDLLREARRQGYGNPVIFLTGQGDTEVAVEAMKAGATDYLAKGRLSAQTLSTAILAALEKQDQEQQKREDEQALMQSIAYDYENLLRQKDMFIDALNLNPQAVILADEHAQVQYINPKAQEILEQVMGQGEFRPLLATLLKAGTQGTREVGRVEYNELTLDIYTVSGTGRMVALLSQRISRDTDFSLLEGMLTPREISVLELLKQGLPNKDIASHLRVSPNTVKRHLDNMYCKLSVSSRTELLAKAYWLLENQAVTKSS